MSALQKKIDEVLNTIDISKEPLIPLNVGAIIICGHDLLISRQHFLRSIGLSYNVHMSRAVFDDLEYAFTDSHFEVPITLSTITFIKNTAQNRSINGKPFIFFVTGLTHANRILQNAMKRLIDTCISNCVFVFPLESLAGIDRGLANRCCIINLLKHSPPSCVLAMDKSITSFLSKVKTLKPIDAILQSRELAYKLFHVNCPLARICKMIIKHFSDDVSIIHELVETLAKLEAHSCKLHKDVFVYEQVLLISQEYCKKQKSITKELSKLTIQKKSIKIKLKS